MARKPSKITVYLIDDESMVRAGLRALLQQSAAFEVVGEASDARSGIGDVARLRPDIAIVDITMPGLSGLDAIAPIKDASPHTKVLIASQHEGQRYVHRSLRAGADGYISKSSDPDELPMAIESIHRGDSFVCPRVVGSLIGRLRGDTGEVSAGSDLELLSRREREVFQLIAVGFPNKRIAATMGVSMGTVKKHRENLQRKLDCHSAAEIARMAIREGLLNP